jgi:hypothetical protein
LPDCCSAAICRTATKLTNCWREGSTSTAIPATFASNVVGQYNKIGAVTFGPPLAPKWFYTGRPLRLASAEHKLADMYWRLQIEAFGIIQNIRTNRVLETKIRLHTKSGLNRKHPNAFILRLSILLCPWCTVDAYVHLSLKGTERKREREMQLYSCSRARAKRHREG